MLVEVYPLKYEQSVREEFQFLLNDNYCAWFNFADRWHPLETFQRDVHSERGSFGKRGQFMGNNLIFLPREHALAKVGPISLPGSA